jgi:arylsulfatase A-like enzyme
MNREEFTPLPNSTPTFIDVLRSNGWFTAAFVGDRDYSQRFGHTARFDFVFDAVNPGAHEDWRTYGVLEQTMPAARAWLRQNKDRRFCLLIQGYDTHCPFAVPKADARFDPDYRGEVDFTKCYWTFEPTRPIKLRSRSGDYEEVYLLKTRPQDGDDYEVMFYPDDIRRMVALYDGEIFNADAQIGGLLDEVAALGLEDRTIVVFYSDHGDMFGKHGRFMRGGPLRGTFYDDVLHIPLLVRHPEYAAQSIEGLAQLIDLGPTLLDMTGCPIPGSFAGKSLLPLVTGKADVNPLVFAGAAFTPSGRNPFFRHHSVILSARSREWKLIQERVSFSVGPQDYFELYDLKKDSEELVNVAAQRDAELEQMKRALRQWLEKIKCEQYLPGGR